MIKWICTATAALSLAAPAHADRPLTDAERAAVTTAVSDRMKDPASTQFRWLPVSDTGAPLYCGLYNAKNSFGGYVGFQAFVARLPTELGGRVEIVQMDTANPRVTTKLAARTCVANHYDLSAAASAPATPPEKP